MPAEEGKCPIWRTKALVESRGDSLMIDSPRAGGKYKITRSALAVLQSNPFDLKEKVKLTDWLVKQHEKEIKEPEITTRILEDVKDRPEKEREERIDRFMLYLLEANHEAYKKFYFGLSELLWTNSDGKTKSISNEEDTLMVYSSSRTREELHEFLEDLEKDGYLEIRKDLPLSHCVMTLKGEEHAKKIRKGKNQKSVNRTESIARWLKERGNAIFEGVTTHIVIVILTAILVSIGLLSL